VDACETERQLAMQVNGEAVAHVVAAADACGADLVHISSDYVFAGEATVPYGLAAEVGPRSVYGESKLRGEREALVYDRATVLRTSWLFGPGGGNFVATIARLLRSGKPLKVVDDQVGGPTYTPFLARAILDLAGARAYGVQHYQNREAVSWHGFAIEIARTLNINTEVAPVSTSEFPRPAHRPSYSVLDVVAFEDIVGRGVEPWSAGLTAYLSGDQS
jgi:dTDP-4-dehydrorhamnose reductase